MERKHRDQVLAQSTEVFNLSKYSAIHWTDYLAKQYVLSQSLEVSVQQRNICQDITLFTLI